MPNQLGCLLGTEYCHHNLLSLSKFNGFVWRFSYFIRNLAMAMIVQKLKSVTSHFSQCFAFERLSIQNQRAFIVHRADNYLLSDFQLHLVDNSFRLDRISYVAFCEIFELFTFCANFFSFPIGACICLSLILYLLLCWDRRAFV